MKILYEHNGALVVISPAAGFDVEAVAQKDVPAGIDYEIVGDDDPRLTAPDPGPLDQPLTKRQIIAAMIKGAGILDPDAAITTAIGEMIDPVARALALNDWRNAPHYVRSHPLFNDPELMAAMNLTSGQIDALWTLGTQQPA